MVGPLTDNSGRKKDQNGRAGETLENYDVICGKNRIGH
jgi:hypothetical protein